jgi:hypothetical protein
VRALETLVGRYPAAALDVPTALPRVPGARRPACPRAARARPDIDRRRAPRRGGVQPRRRGEGRAPAEDLAHGERDQHLEQPVRAAEPQQSGRSLGANLAAPIFNGYALEAQVDIRNAEQRLAIARLRRRRAARVRRSGVRASAALDGRRARSHISRASVTSNARTLELANVRFNVGSGDLRAVLQQNVALYRRRTACCRRRRNGCAAHQPLPALGGSFEPARAAGRRRGRRTAANAARGRTAMATPAHRADRSPAPRERFREP